MGLEFYKRGQGSWARLSAYVFGGALIVFGAFRLYASINRPGEHVYANVPVLGALSAFKIIALTVALLGLLGLHLVLNKPRSVDLMIETEQEMRRVQWPAGKAVWNATLVVAFVSLLLAVVMWLLDLVLRQLFLLFF
jgi:preprotein translocase SecE subunit